LSQDSELPRAVRFLGAAIDRQAVLLRPSGELDDPFFGEPTQYGTAYHAFCNAALAKLCPSPRREIVLDRAERGLDAALTHTADIDLPPTLSEFDRATGSTKRSSHRDFTWPAILKGYRLLREAGSTQAGKLAERIADVDVERSFRSRPPSNWSSVWLSGEWIRLREGLSPFSVDQIDRWIAPFFHKRILLDTGFYQQEGLANSYDLFTRFHLADMVAEGYEGSWREPLERLLVTGLDRSLLVQLSDGSLASAHRSTGHTWTIGAELAFFTLAARLVAHVEPARVIPAQAAARLAFESFIRWMRADGTYSPVENCLQPAARVGYERYSADAHYSSLALAFLATAVLAGFDADPGEPTTVSTRPASLVEGAPTHRAVIHSGRMSVQVNGNPAPDYDGFGITDVTFGPSRYLQFCSTTRHMRSGKLFNLGLACRAVPGRSPLTVIAQQALELAGPIERLRESSGLRLLATSAKGWPMRVLTRRLLSEQREGGSRFKYNLVVEVFEDGAAIYEATPGVVGYKTLLVPYVRDPGTGTTTEVRVAGNELSLAHGTEEISISLEQDIEHVMHLPHGYENRRGLCGLLRVDLREPVEGITYRVHVHL